MNKPIYVTQSVLPELADFIPYLEQIWDNKTLTNGGPFRQELEVALSQHLGVKNISLFSNGTKAILNVWQSILL